MDRRQFIVGSLAVMGSRVPAFSGELPSPTDSWVLRAKDADGETLVWAELSHEPITGLGRIDFDDVTWENNSGGIWRIARLTASLPDDYGIPHEVEFPVSYPIPISIFPDEKMTVSGIAIELF